jgi:hypothetical protein
MLPAPTAPRRAPKTTAARRPACTPRAATQPPLATYARLDRALTGCAISPVRICSQSDSPSRRRRRHAPAIRVRGSRNVRLVPLCDTGQTERPVAHPPPGELTGPDVMLKVTLPDVDDFYAELLDHANVLRVLALSGG